VQARIRCNRRRRDHGRPQQTADMRWVRTTPRAERCAQGCGRRPAKLLRRPLVLRAPLVLTGCEWRLPMRRTAAGPRERPHRTWAGLRLTLRGRRPGRWTRAGLLGGRASGRPRPGALHRRRRGRRERGGRRQCKRAPQLRYLGGQLEQRAVALAQRRPARARGTHRAS